MSKNIKLQVSYEGIIMGVTIEMAQRSTRSGDAQNFSTQSTNNHQFLPIPCNFFQIRPPNLIRTPPIPHLLKKNPGAPLTIL
jgi:hypothetical protein